MKGRKRKGEEVISASASGQFHGSITRVSKIGVMKLLFPASFTPLQGEREGERG